MKSYTDLISANEEEIEGVYDDSLEASYSEAPEKTAEVKFSIGKEYQANIENSLSRLESKVSSDIDADVRFKVEECDCGIKIASTNIANVIGTKLFKSVVIESGCVSDFEKEPSTGHSIAKFYFKAKIEGSDSNPIEISIPNGEYWFDFDLNDWMSIKK